MDRIAPGAPTGGARTNMRPAGRWELARHALATDEQRPIDLRPSTATIQGTVPRPGAATVVGTRTPRAGARGARRTRAPAFRVARRILRERLQRPPPCRRRPRAPRAAVPRAEIASVVVRAPEPFGLGTLPLRGDPALDRPPARSRPRRRGSPPSAPGRPLGSEAATAAPTPSPSARHPRAGRRADPAHASVARDPKRSFWPHRRSAPRGCRPC